MGSAIGGILGGNGGGLMSAIGGVVGGMFGGPIGAMIGQAVGNLVQDAIGSAVKEVVGDLVKEQGMPKFLADEVKQKVDEVISGLKDKSVSEEATTAAKDAFGAQVDKFQQEFKQNFADAIAQNGGDTETSGKGGKGGGGWLQAIAKAMGSVLGQKASEMVKLSNEMSALNDKKTNGSSEEQQQAANEFNQKMTQFQATSQEYSLLNNTFSTAIKALGEALGSMARKQ